MKNLLMNFTIDKAAKKVHVEREFAAPLATVWSAWTESKWLDQWWAPKPWKAETKEMDFRVGGHWLYAMVGPANERHWALAEYTAVEPKHRFVGEDAFCDENGKVIADMPRTTWEAKFSDEGAMTRVDIHISFKSLADLEAQIKMGFKEGFTMGMENLDELLGGK